MKCTECGGLGAVDDRECEACGGDGEATAAQKAHVLLESMKATHPGLADGVVERKELKI